MPRDGIGFDFLPWTKTGQRRVKHHHPADGFGIKAGESIGHYSTDVVTGNVHALQMQLFRQLVNVFRHIRSVVAVGAGSGTTHTAQVHGNDRKLLRQSRHDLMELIPVLGKTMQQQDRRSQPPAHVMESCSIHLCGDRDEPASKRRERWIEWLL
jgi:hypothetical protein